MELDLTGHLNFSFLIILGNLFLLPIAFLLWRVHRSDDGDLNRQVIEFVPISLIFFSLSYWESLNWAMAGLQNLPVILFSFFAIYLLIPRRGESPSPFRLALACVASILAAFSSANGFLLAPVGAFVLVRRRAYIASLVWCASFLLPFAAYVYHYVPYHVSVDTIHRRAYLAKIFYFFAVLGCAIPFRWVAAFLGITILAVFVLAVRSRFEHTNPVPFYFTVWILVTAFLVAWLRKGVASRYSIYSLFLLIFCYWFLAQYLPERFVWFSRKRLYVISIVLATLLCLVSDLRAYVYLKGRQQMVLSGIQRYRENPEINSPMIDPKMMEVDRNEAEFERVTLARAIQRQVYALPPMH